MFMETKVHENTPCCCIQRSLDSADEQQLLREDPTQKTRKRNFKNFQYFYVIGCKRVLAPSFSQCLASDFFLSLNSLSR